MKQETFKKMPTFNVLFKDVSRIKTNNLFKIKNICLLFRSFVNVT